MFWKTETPVFRSIRGGDSPLRLDERAKALRIAASEVEAQAEARRSEIYDTLFHVMDKRAEALRPKPPVVDPIDLARTAVPKCLRVDEVEVQR